MAAELTGDVGLNDRFKKLEASSKVIAIASRLGISQLMYALLVGGGRFGGSQGPDIWELILDSSIHCC